jgi:hypothetical protein
MTLSELDALIVCNAFENIVSFVERRDRCCRVEALQRAVNENPERFATYCAAIQYLDARKVPASCLLRNVPALPTPIRGHGDAASPIGTYAKVFPLKR